MSHDDKLLGTTIDEVVVDLGEKNFTKGQVYVGLSHVKNLGRDNIVWCRLKLIVK